MISAQKSWHQPRRAHTETPRHLHEVYPTEALRPRWKALYVAVGVIGLVAVAAHLLVHEPVLLKVADAGVGFGLFVTLVGWVHLNRVALACSGTGPERPHVRIVQSREREPEERVILPYDFK